MNDKALQQLCDAARSFHRRGYAFGSTGNLSVRAGDRVWITRTGGSLAETAPDSLAEIGMDGRPLNDCKPSKEYPFHLAAYHAAGDRAGAIVHLHSTYSVALACLKSPGARDPLPAFTPYYLMRVAPLAVLPYFRPGSAGLAAAVGQAAASHNALLLRNHGLICLGRDMSEAVDRAEELEETAKLHFILRNERVRLLTAAERKEIALAFSAPRPAASTAISGNRRRK